MPERGCWGYRECGERGVRGQTTQGFVGHCKDFGFYRDGKSSQGWSGEVTGKPVRSPTPSSREERMVTWPGVVSRGGDEKQLGTV